MVAGADATSRYVFLRPRLALAQHPPHLSLFSMLAYANAGCLGEYNAYSAVTVIVDEGRNAASDFYIMPAIEQFILPALVQNVGAALLTDIQSIEFQSCINNGQATFLAG